MGKYWFEEMGGKEEGIEIIKEKKMNFISNQKINLRLIFFSLLFSLSLPFPSFSTLLFFLPNMGQIDAWLQEIELIRLETKILISAYLIWLI